MRAIVLALGLCLTAAGVVTAQPSTSQRPAGQSSADQSGAAELKRLHDSLHLDSAQETAWRAYVAAISNPQAEARHRAAQELLPTLPTPRRITLLQATLAADQEDLRREGASVTAFYNQLSPAQQQTFDRETLPRANAAAGRSAPGQGR